MSAPDRKTAVAKAINAYNNLLSQYGQKALNEIFSDSVMVDADLTKIEAAFMPYYYIYPSKWFSTFLKLEPSDYLQEVKCPVLALNGSFDTQVLPITNTEAIRKALTASGNKNVTIKILPNLNHLFQYSDDIKKSLDYSGIEETFSPIALQEISNWLDKNIK